MNKVKEYFEQLFMNIGMLSHRVQKLDNSVARVEKLVRRKTSKKKKIVV